MKLIDINLRPDRRTLFQFGFICLAAFGALGGLILWKKAIWGLELGDTARPLAFGLFGAGILSAFLSLAAPSLNRYLFVGLAAITFPIGFVVSHVLMAILFYLILTPMGLLFRLIGRDPLCRKFDSETRSYWVDHRDPDRVDRYFSQF